MKRKIYRDDILDAGLNLMFEHGYNATGIKDITDQVEIPKGSFYNHFKSKEDFGLELVKGYSDRGVEYHKKVLLDKTIAPFSRLEQFYSGMIEGYRGERDSRLGCIMSNFSSEMADVNENFRKVLEEGFHEQEAIIVECLEEAQEKGEIKKEIDCKSYGNFMINSWHGALIRMKADSSVKALENFYETIFTYLRA